ncbi:MAG: NUDIX domain-containing protein [Candidatus Marinimicrobia bacterium]|nr:NUDIX domain-containing protein [Candidatus Neomarinimicrobiota bacterium]
MKNSRKYCEKCATLLESRIIEKRVRDYCPSCKLVYYDNPLPVASAIVVNQKREILLVLRDREPQAGKWGLPSGFAELNETIEAAAIRELQEETGINGEVMRLIDTRSLVDAFYGDLIWVTYEVNIIGGELQAGDDAREAAFFNFENLPPLAFPTNEHAVKNYLSQYQQIWMLEDSMDTFDGDRLQSENELPSDTLFEIMVRDANIIAENWVIEVVSHATTPHYASRPRKEIFDIAHRIISELGRWITQYEIDQHEIWSSYQNVGGDRFSEGYKLSEVISALSLTRKHIFAHVLARSKSWREPLQIYRVIEFMSRVNLFYDKANYHLSCGYEKRRKDF